MVCSPPPGGHLLTGVFRRNVLRHRRKKAGIDIERATSAAVQEPESRSRSQQTSAFLTDARFTIWRQAGNPRRAGREVAEWSHPRTSFFVGAAHWLFKRTYDNFLLMISSSNLQTIHDNFFWNISCSHACFFELCSDEWDLTRNPNCNSVVVFTKDCLCAGSALPTVGRTPTMDFLAKNAYIAFSIGEENLIACRRTLYVSSQKDDGFFCRSEDLLRNRFVWNRIELRLLTIHVCYLHELILNLC